MNDDLLPLKDRYAKNDVLFNELYPISIKILSKLHWTPVYITKLAVNFLADKGSKILDIGSGAGKFCLTGACYAPEVHFYGVEQRKYLIDQATKVQKRLGIENVSFINANFTSLNLQEFDHFYYYNAFYENLDYVDRIDDNIEYSEALYEYYIKYLYKALTLKPAGTKIVTYHSFKDEIPRGYHLVESHADGELNFWIKQ